MTSLSVVPATIGQQVADTVSGLRDAGLRAMAAYNSSEGDHAAVIIPPPRGHRGGGQFHVTPTTSGLRVRWRPTDGSQVTVDVVDTPARAARLILDHLAGLYP